MPVISCTHCGAKGNAPESVLGQTVRCSKCKQSFVAQGDGADAPALDEEISEAPAPARRARQEVDDFEDDDEPVRRKPKRRSRVGGGSGFLDFITFRAFVGPYIIMVMYWLWTIGVIIGGLMLLVTAFQFGGGAAIFLILTSLLYIIIGPIGVRLVCELLAIAFRVHETLQDILGELRK